MKYTEEQKKLINGVLDKYAVQYANVSAIEQFKKEQGLLPSLEVGKWYKENGGSIAFYQGDDTETYGIGDRWVDNACWFHSWNRERDSWQEATPQEVETALIAEAKRRGFKEGVKYDCVVSDVKDCIWDEGDELGSNEWQYFSGDNTLSMVGNQFIFNNGKWATIADDKLSKLEAKYKELGEEIETLKNEKL